MLNLSAVCEHCLCMKVVSAWFDMALFFTKGKWREIQSEKKTCDVRASVIPLPLPLLSKRQQQQCLQTFQTQQAGIPVCVPSVIVLKKIAMAQ